jgi:O-6-methylguanine DNA methyltransferase
MHQTIETPVGILSLEFSEKGLQELRKLNTKSAQKGVTDKNIKAITPELDEYFAGKRQTFDIPLDVPGTPFQKAVWKATAAIPFGTTVTYGDIAAKIGRPRAVRAVGTALGKNPVCIIVPCHRVVPKGGGIGQYAYGTDMKQWLIDFEKEQVSQ